jgi:hypothetical protein
MLCLIGQSIQADSKNPFADLLGWLPGDYSTEAQASADQKNQAAYRHVHAQLRIVRLPKDNAISAEKPVFYLEQALAGQEAEPYRQRILVFELLPSGQGRLNDFRITEPKDLVGASVEKLKTLSPERLTRQGGCEEIWEPVDAGLYKGTTGVNRACKTSLRGATHVINYAELTPRTLTSLDQGFDDSGAHKWGPPPGVIGHIFRKRDAR